MQATRIIDEGALSSAVYVSLPQSNGSALVTKNTSGMSLVDLGKRLLDAAKRGDTEEVRSLMSNGAPFTTDWLGTSPLHFATQYGHLDTAEVLLRAGISRDARTKVDRTPLHVAAQEGHVDIVDLLIQHSADIDARDMLKMTPLHWATEKGHVDVIQTLLKHGADVNRMNKFDRTPLDIAIVNGRTDIANLLQLAQHTEVNGLDEGNSVTIETTEIEESPLETVTVTTTDNIGDAKILPVNFFQNSKEGSKSPDQNNSSVLATLAALAEATAPGSTSQAVNTSDAVSWLESQGITMITTTDGGIITSAVESGQTLTLTEAGKIALNLMKQQNLTEEDIVEDEDGNQKVITIVADDDQETDLQTDETSDIDKLQIVTNEMPLQTLDMTSEDDEPETKRMKLTDAGEDGDGLDTEGGQEVVTLATTCISETGDRDELRKQLEEIQRQAEAYKQQLKAKEEEAEKYKKKLSEIHKDDEEEVVCSIEGGVLTMKDEVISEEIIEEQEVEDS